MALVLTKEDGTGKADANSYANVADGDAYHEAHVYAATWLAATPENKEKALVMATRLLDACFQFNGTKVSGTQALQWPRVDCRDPDGSDPLSESQVPTAVVHATCELARHLLSADVTEDPGGEGLRSFRLEGAFKLEFRGGYPPSLLPGIVRQLLGKLGRAHRPDSGPVKLVRT